MATANSGAVRRWLSLSAASRHSCKISTLLSVIASEERAPASALQRGCFPARVEGGHSRLTSKLITVAGRRTVRKQDIIALTPLKAARRHSYSTSAQGKPPGLFHRRYGVVSSALQSRPKIVCFGISPRPPCTGISSRAAKNGGNSSKKSLTNSFLYARTLAYCCGARGPGKGCPPSSASRRGKRASAKDDFLSAVFCVLAQRLLLNVCDAPKAQVGQIAPLAITCPFGTSQTPHIGVCASLKGMAES